MEGASSFWLTIVGGLLAAGAGLIVETWKEWRTNSWRRKTLAQVIRDDLNYVATIYERLLDEWARMQVVNFVTTADFSASRAAYLKNSEWVVVFPDPALRREILDYYQKSHVVIVMLEQFQRRSYELQSLMMREVVNVMSTFGGMTRDNAEEIARTRLPAETQEAGQIVRGLPELIGRVRDMRDVAKDLLTRLPSS